MRICRLRPNNYKKKIDSHETTVTEERKRKKTPEINTFAVIIPLL